MKWALKLSQGLSRTASGFSENLTSILKSKKIDTQVMEELEDLLISSDFGVNTSQEIIASLQKEKLNNLDQDKIKEFLSNKISNILKKRYVPLDRFNMCLRPQNRRRSRPPTSFDCYFVFCIVISWKLKMKSTHVEYI